MGACTHCGTSSSLISGTIGICLPCLRAGFEGLNDYLREVHRKSREPFGLPASPPRDPGGITCKLCSNSCQITDGGIGYCGIRSVKGGKIRGGTKNANVDWYHDPLPTNCVADWVCPAGTGIGYPQYAYKKGPEHGYKNLAVFYNACSFNCLYCQNWHFRERVSKGNRVLVSELAGSVDKKTACICYFGGDPTPQLIHSINVSKRAIQENRGRILRVCWETNGSMNQGLLSQMIEISLKSGGCIKFDLKAWTENLHLALCGVSNKRTLDNFELVSRHIHKRPEVPLLVASTLLVPGYIDREEIYKIASFICSCSPDIPYSLLGFYPHFFMTDLPKTTRAQAEECRQAAREAGLTRIKIGNVHLLS
jgi:pyruvate formate lyase activating enzyme